MIEIKLVADHAGEVVGELKALLNGLTTTAPNITVPKLTVDEKSITEELPITACDEVESQVTKEEKVLEASNEEQAEELTDEELKELRAKIQTKATSISKKTKSSATVKSLLEDYNVEKLSDVPSAKVKEFLSKLEAI